MTTQNKLPNTSQYFTENAFLKKVLKIQTIILTNEKSSSLNIHFVSSRSNTLNGNTKQRIVVKNVALQMIQCMRNTTPTIHCTAHHEIRKRLWMIGCCYS